MIYRLCETGLLLLTLAFLGACQSAESSEAEVQATDGAAFNDYWYSGKAELTRYQLEQARYGEVHPGEAVLVFVTEDFLMDRQVKHEFGPGAKAQSVLKLNSTRKFFTGVYPYSVMSSVFKVVSDPERPPVKVTTSVQEWCGHVYMQFNHREDQYDVKQFSYFQSEGDRMFELEAGLMEDEVWSRIRLDPGSLPTGEIALIPGTQHLRLRHQEARPRRAVASLERVHEPEIADGPLRIYTIDYHEIDRVLKIWFEEAFPHRIMGWEEAYPSGFGDPVTLTTRAVRTHELVSPYWAQHSLADSTSRKQLGVGMN